MEELVALLPCKPDHAQRQVQLGSLNTTLQVSGCETAGALYAISHVRVADPSQLKPTKNAWREATFATLQAGSVQTEPLRLAKPRAGQAYTVPSAGDAASHAELSLEKLEGKRSDGSAVQAQMVWLAKGQDLYHVAVFGTRLDKEKTELLFSELRLQ